MCSLVFFGRGGPLSHITANSVGSFKVQTRSPAPTKFRPDTHNGNTTPICTATRRLEDRAAASSLLEGPAARLRQCCDRQPAKSPSRQWLDQAYVCSFALRGLDLRAERFCRASFALAPAIEPTGHEEPQLTNSEEMSKVHQPIKTYPPPPTATAKCKDPIAAVTQSQLSVLDPTGARAHLFSKANPEAAKVGDILLVRQKNGDPFAGVCLNIRRRGVDTAVLLRNQLTRVGVEMWYKVFSPNVEGIEVVQRREKRARRARLYYMRKPKHDLGSVDNIVRQYQRQRAMLRSGGAARGRDANAGKRGGKKGK